MVAALVAAAGAGALATPAAAHTALERSAPAADASVAAPPTAVELVFTEPVSARLATVVVTGPDGADATEGPVQVSGASVVQPLRADAAPGRYRVAYRVVAADGHPITGTYDWTGSWAAAPPSPAATVSPSVAPSAAAPSPASSAAVAPAAATDGDGGEDGGLVSAVAALAVVAGGVAMLARRRRRGGEQTPG